MKYSYKKMKIKDELIVDGIINKFEEISPIAKSLKDMSLTLKYIALVGILYFFVICLIQKYVFITLIFMICIVTIIICYLIKKSSDVLYSNSKNIKGKKSVSFISINRNLDVVTFNLGKMRKEELIILKRILKVNNIKSLEQVKELKAYYSSKKDRKPFSMKNFIKDILSLYAIPITFGIVNIYTAINIDLELTTYIVDISYIFFTAIVILSIILIVYLIFEIRKVSTTNYYVIPRLEKLLLELILENKFM